MVQECILLHMWFLSTRDAFCAFGILTLGLQEAGNGADHDCMYFHVAANSLELQHLRKYGKYELQL